MIIKTLDPKKGKEVSCGSVEDDTYYRKVGNKHFMVKHNGYGIQMDVFKKLVKMGVYDVEIITKAGTKHRAPLYTWLSKGKKDDFGHGPQLFLDITYMGVSK